MTHITHTANGKKYLIQQVPKEWEYDPNDIQIIADDELGIGIKNPDPDYDNWITKYISLPRHGNYTYLFVAEQATEEQAEMLVERDSSLFYKDYRPNTSPKNCYFETAQGSLNSLTRTFPDHQQFNHVILLKEK